jgi:hypothetical protein
MAVTNGEFVAYERSLAIKQRQSATPHLIRTGRHATAKFAEPLAAAPGQWAKRAAFAVIQ